jgi:hypothetical protein
MKVQSRSQQLLCAYALMLTLAAGVIALDPMEQHTNSLLADVPIPTPKVFKAPAVRNFPPNADGSDRLARR